jgi:predicted membrane protein
MEQKEFETRRPMQSSNTPKNNNVLGGLVLVLIGLVILIKNIPSIAALFPYWLFTWPVLVMIVGIGVGLTHRFRGIGWLIIMAVGAYFLAYQNGMVTFNPKPFILPLVLIAIGISVMMKRNRRKHCNRFRRPNFEHQSPGFHVPPVPVPPTSGLGESTSNNGEDILNVNSVFSSVDRTVLSKCFKGGKINCLFGGTEINLAQADFNGTVVLNLSISFGGAEITIPSNWQVQNEISVILGGLDDKRRFVPSSEPVKTLILQGSVLCGGVELRS